MVKPRMAEKTPIMLTEDEEARVLHAILRDLRLMALRGLHLSGKLLDQLGQKFGEKYKRMAAEVSAQEESLLTEAADRAEAAGLEEGAVTEEAGPKSARPGAADCGTGEEGSRDAQIAI